MSDIVEQLQLIAAWNKPSGPTPAQKQPNRYKAAMDAIAEISRLTAERDALRVDAERWHWAKPILSGDDDATANQRALILATALMTNIPIEVAIDVARTKEQP